MSDWLDCPSEDVSLNGRDGALVCARVTVEPRLLEELLETLAELPFPVNPQIYHHLGHEPVEVEFPTYVTGLEKVRRALAEHGFPEEVLEARSMLNRLQAT